MNENTPLSAFLKARRQRVSPQDIGLLQRGNRRVTGLRRDEVARLAGISTPYYVRLEQGRGHEPSPEVLNALARVLLLDEIATEHLHELDRPTRKAAAPGDDESVLESLRGLLSGWNDLAAFVQDRYGEVLVATSLAPKVMPMLTPRTNLQRAAFLTNAMRHICEDWEACARALVAGLRERTRTETDDPRLAALIDELCAGSADFRRLWESHDVATSSGCLMRLGHPVAGPISLRYEAFTVAGTTGYLLVTLQAEPGTDSERALAKLAKAPGVRSIPPRTLAVRSLDRWSTTATVVPTNALRQSEDLRTAAP
jgi:transcriptional regulator with XRE-family HTH domain